jgi:hypothetical protein
MTQLALNIIIRTNMKMVLQGNGMLEYVSMIRLELKEKSEHFLRQRRILILDEMTKKEQTQIWNILRKGYRSV